MTDRKYFQERAAQMARIQARWLLSPSNKLSPQTSLSQMIALVRDHILHLNQPTIGIELALSFHESAVRWSAWGAWATAINTALEATKELADQENMIRMLIHRSHIARELGDYALGVESATTALQIAEAINRPDLIAISMNRLGALAYLRDQLITARDYWERGYAIGREHMPEFDLAFISMNLGTVASDQERFNEAEEWLRIAMKHAIAINDSKLIALVRNSQARLYELQNNLEMAITLWKEAAHGFKEITYGLAIGENNIGYAYLTLGQFEPALDYFERSKHHFEYIGSTVGEALVLSNLAELYVTTKAWEQATETLAKARRLAVMCNKPVLVAAIDVDIGRMLVAEHDYAGARQLWEQALRVQTEAGAQNAAGLTKKFLATLSQIKDDSAV